MFQRLYLFPWPEVFQGQGQTGRSLGRRELTYVTVTLKEIEIEKQLSSLCVLSPPLPVCTVEHFFFFFFFPQPLNEIWLVPLAFWYSSDNRKIFKYFNPKNSLISLIKMSSCVHQSNLRILFLGIGAIFRREGLPWWLSGKEPSCQCRGRRFNLWARKIPRRRN